MSDARKILNTFEASFKQNIGFVELVQFYKTASPSEIKEMEKIVKKNDWEKFKEIIERVLKVRLV